MDELVGKHIVASIARTGVGSKIQQHLGSKVHVHKLAPSGNFEAVAEGASDGKTPATPARPWKKLGARSCAVVCTIDVTPVPSRRNVVRRNVRVWLFRHHVARDGLPFRKGVVAPGTVHKRWHCTHSHGQSENCRGFHTVTKLDEAIGTFLHELLSKIGKMKE